MRHPDKIVAALEGDGTLDRFGIKSTNATGGKVPPSAKAASNPPFVIDSSEYPRSSKPVDPYRYTTGPECDDHAEQATEDAGWIKNRFSYCQKHVVAIPAVSCTIFPIRCRVEGVFVARATLIGFGKIGSHEEFATQRWADFRLGVEVLTATGPFNDDADMEASVECLNRDKLGSLDPPEDLVDWWRLTDGFDDPRAGNLVPVVFQPLPVTEVVLEHARLSGFADADCCPRGHLPAGEVGGGYCTATIPICRDVGGDVLVVDLRPGDQHGRLARYSTRQGFIPTEWAGTTALLADLADRLHRTSADTGAPGPGVGGPPRGGVGGAGGGGRRGGAGGGRGGAGARRGAENHRSGPPRGGGC
ncbi:hypothetical protein, partial [Umezawaea sp. NPDC059074]|uniref:hypothetical protein n=1 Tax=Umezawaea sp. NPDC059074 TaxID=3346716 RepID=UPI0036C17E6F